MGNYLKKKSLIYPLVTFRILFGGLMAYSAWRFVDNGWIEKLFFEPDFFFKYYGFHWVSYMGDAWMYPLYGIMIASAIGIAIGFFYRLNTILFFLTFSYTELLDATNYLNHHYLVGIFALFLIFLPAHRAVSLDSRFGLVKGSETVPSWCIDVIKIQIIIVYTCAGIAKLNSDWLIHGMPLSIWLPEHTDIPILGYFFSLSGMGLFMSWAGALYDLSIGYLLLWRPTRLIAYSLVVIFHLLTYLLFNIGLFPFIMITSNMIFFSGKWHKRFYSWLSLDSASGSRHFVPRFSRPLIGAFVVFLFIQAILPFRHHLYEGDVLWTEEGYRFSWRVMLVEKVGLTTFYVKDRATGRSSEILNCDYLTTFQEKQMSIQPDFILQFAEYLSEHYVKEYGFVDPVVTADAHVALNTRTSKRLFSPEQDLLSLEDDFKHKDWIILAER